MNAKQFIDRFGPYARVFRKDDVSAEARALSAVASIPVYTAGAIVGAVRADFLHGRLQNNHLKMIDAIHKPHGYLSHPSDQLREAGVLVDDLAGEVIISGQHYRFGPLKGLTGAPHSIYHLCPEYASGLTPVMVMAKHLDLKPIDAFGLYHSALAIASTTGRFAAKELRERREIDASAQQIEEAFSVAKVAHPTGRRNTMLLVDALNSTKTARQKNYKDRVKKDDAKKAARTAYNTAYVRKKRAEAKQKAALSTPPVNTLSTPVNAVSTECQQLTHPLGMGHTHTPDAEFGNLSSDAQSIQTYTNLKDNNNELETKIETRGHDAMQSQAGNWTRDFSDPTLYEQSPPPPDIDDGPPWSDDDIPPPIDDPWQGRQDWQAETANEPAVVVGDLHLREQENPEPARQSVEPPHAPPIIEPGPTAEASGDGDEQTEITDPDLLAQITANTSPWMLEYLQRAQRGINTAKQRGLTGTGAPEAQGSQTPANAPQSVASTEPIREHAPATARGSETKTRPRAPNALRRLPKGYQMPAPKPGLVPQDLDQPVTGFAQFRRYINKAGWLWVEETTPEHIRRALEISVSYRELEIMRAHLIDKQSKGPNFRRKPFGYVLPIIESEREKAEKAQVMEMPTGWARNWDSIAIEEGWDYPPRALLKLIWGKKTDGKRIDLTGHQIRCLFQASGRNNWAEVAGKLNVEWANSKSFDASTQAQSDTAAMADMRELENVAGKIAMAKAM